MGRLVQNGLPFFNINGEKEYKITSKEKDKSIFLARAQDMDFII